MFSPRSWFLASAIVVFLTVLMWPADAGAHTSLESSDPAAGAVALGAVDTVELTFNRAVDPITGSFEILDSAGQPVEITAVDASADGVVTVVPTDSLADGQFGVVWAVRGTDGHPVSDVVTFTAGPAIAASPVADELAVAPGLPQTSAVEPAPVSTELAEAIDASGSGTFAADALAWLGRVLMYAGVLLGVGGLIYLLFVHEGSVGESRMVVHWIRRAALVVLAATALEALAQVAVTHDGSFGALAGVATYQHTFAGQFGLGLVLRAGGAIAMLIGIRMSLDHIAVDESLAYRPRGRFDRDPFPELTAARLQSDDVEIEVFLDGEVQVEVSETPPVVTATEPVVRTTVTRVRLSDSRLAFGGAASVVASFLFIGHTASEGPRLITAFADAVHVGAGAAWLGGVCLLARTLWLRRQEGRPPEAALLLGRFSTVATIALAAVTLAGMVLTLVVLPYPAAL